MKVFKSNIIVAVFSTNISLSVYLEFVNQESQTVLEYA
jgi:hypothetical protein